MKSNMFFSCGPSQADRQVVPSKYYRKDDMDILYYKMTAPVHVRLDGKLTKVEGPVIFIAMGDDFWSKDGTIKNYRSKIVENPTYRTLMGAATASQKVTGDYHHSFIEGVTFGGHEEHDGRKVMVLKMQFGS